VPGKKEFQAVFESLREILKEYEPRLVVLHDKPGNYYLNTPYCEKFKKEICFGAVAVKKNYVSYYFMPIYGCPEMARELSPELKARMQGKACFNFKEVDRDLFKELAQLTKAGFDRFKKAGFIETEKKSGRQTD
jgi:hypothetical protein